MKPVCNSSDKLNRQGIPVIEDQNDLYNQMTDGELSEKDKKYLSMIANRKQYKRSGKKYSNTPGRIKRRQNARRRDGATNANHISSGRK